MSQETTESPSFDQIVKGNVSIKKLSEHRYRITFSKIGKFLMYQVWDKDSPALNKKRSVGYVSAKKWVKAFKESNEELENDEPLFTPTTIMETEDDHIYAFVIHKACLNSHDQVVFTVSTKEISLQNNTSKKLVQLPCGKCNNVRFDIDNIIDFLNNIISMEYDSQLDGYSIYKNVRINNQQLTKTKLKEILDKKNIDYKKNGMYYMINTKNQLDISNNSITLTRCNNCGFGFFLFYVYDYSSNPDEQDLISTVQIKTFIFPSGVDPTKITSILFVGE